MSLAYKTLAPEAVYVKEKTGLDFLDEGLEMLQEGNIKTGMSELVGQLYNTYASTSSTDWARLVERDFLRHPIRKLLMQDPLTARSFYRPRGYAGDAELLDSIYFPQKMNLENTSSIGRKIYHVTTGVGVARALRERKEIVAKHIGETASRASNARVLSIACGHCREAELSSAIQNRELGTFVGLDQDQDSLNLVNQQYGSLGIETTRTSITDIVRGHVVLGQFDLIYSSGLYDYLGKRLAQKLTAQLFKMLAPGGKLVLFNIIPDFPEIGYFESFMNWSLIGRDQGDMLELAADLPTGGLASLKVGHGAEESFNYIEIKKN